jgi:antitoxin MazE
MAALRLKEVGGAMVVEIPGEVVARLGMKEGDALFLVETEHGISLTPHSPEIAEQVEIGMKFMDKYEETFKRLAR